MVCPECHAEYIAGATECRDCLVPLVVALPAAAPQARTSRSALAGSDRALAVCALAVGAVVLVSLLLSIAVRAGCHTGEIELLGTDIGGIAVHIGARMSALAGPSEVLVSSTVKDLVAGSGLTFAERGEHELKGVPGNWHLYALANAP